MSEDRQAIEKEIFRLRRAINVELTFGSPEIANRLRDQIGDLERHIEQIEREAREGKKDTI
jgi:hypothetical protein